MFSKFNAIPKTNPRFSIAAFGRKGVSEIELIFIRQLVRNHLFIHDDLRMNLFDGFDRNTAPGIRSDHNNGWQSFIDILAKVVHVDKLATVDHFGFPTLISFISRGYVLGGKTINGENIIQTLVHRSTRLSTEYSDIPSQLANYLLQCLRKAPA